jgi:hypothetical protein
MFEYIAVIHTCKLDYLNGNKQKNLGMKDCTFHLDILDRKNKIRFSNENDLVKTQESSSNSALASFKSAVSNPSVNHP